MASPTSADFLFWFPECCFEGIVKPIKHAKVYYRAVASTIELTRKDFTPLALQNRNAVNPKCSKQKLCGKYGVSLFSDINVLKNKIDTLPNFSGGKHIAKCIIDSNSGYATDEVKISTHINWYPFANYYPEERFEIVI